jgi:hypothetical protein
LRRRRQHHQRIGKDRECAVEMNFSEPGRIEAECVPELDLRDEIPIPPLL